METSQDDQAFLDPALIGLTLPSCPVGSIHSASRDFLTDPTQLQNGAIMSGSDTNIFPFPTLPATYSEYVDSEATARSSKLRRFPSPGSTYQSSDAGLASDVSEGMATTWSSPDINDMSVPVTMAAPEDPHWMFDSTSMDLLNHHYPSFLYPSIENGLEIENGHVHGSYESNKLISEQSYPTIAYGQMTPVSSDTPASVNDLSVPKADYAWAPPVIKRRRTQASRTSTSPQPPSSRVHKRKVTASRHSPREHETTSHNRGRVSPGPARSFVCPLAPYGCQSTFATKNEWKRHTLTQHMRMGFWRCDQCPQSGHRPNDFNRKDLFVQHVRRMHPDSFTIPDPHVNANMSTSARSDYEEQALGLIAQRCYLRLRTPPTRCACLFCDLDFEGTHAWDERIEHIGRHLETAKKKNQEPPDVVEWRVDHELEQWLAREQIIEWYRGEWVFTQDRQG